MSPVKNSDVILTVWDRNLMGLPLISDVQVALELYLAPREIGSRFLL